MHFPLLRMYPVLHWHPLNWQASEQLAGDGWSQVGGQGFGQSTTSAFGSSQPRKIVSGKLLRTLW